LSQHESLTLLDHVVEHERLQAIINDLKADQKSVIKAARAQGFDSKGFREVIKYYRMSESEREEFEAIRELMMREMGWLADTPLGSAAIRRFENAYLPKSPENGANGHSGPQEGGEAPEGSDAAPKRPGRAPAVPRPPEKTQEEKEAELKEEFRLALEAGTEAGKQWVENGQDPKYGFLSNPYLGFNPCRLEWAKGWRSATGSDGMELPPHLKSKKKPKKKKDDDKKDGKDGE
jgi:uncharacterized protein (UPF0335 family)